MCVCLYVKTVRVRVCVCVSRCVHVCASMCVCLCECVSVCVVNEQVVFTTRAKTRRRERGGYGGNTENYLLINLRTYGSHVK